MARGYKTGGRTAGTPNKTQREDKILAQKYGPKSIEGLAELAGFHPKKKGSENDQVRLSAMEKLLDRAYGKPTQPIGGDDDHPPLQVSEIVRRVVNA